jgi:DNA repair protein RadA/Sms
MAGKKSKQVFLCDNCGYESPKWLGQCPNCKSWNTFSESVVSEIEQKTNRLLIASDNKVQNLLEVNAGSTERILSGFREFDSVVGGGVLPDQVLLLTGDPGVGKSTLLLQIALKLTTKHKVLYVSAEESAAQVAGRAKRIGQQEHIAQMLFLNTGSLGNIMSEIDAHQPDVVLLDSIQTIYDEETTGVAGSIMQVKSIAAKLVFKAKQTGFLLFLIGHVNKEGEIAGPKVLEHLVDTVLNFEGDNLLDYRVLRSLKNRFGQVGEVGIFMMEEGGLADISPETNIFIDASAESNTGIVRTVIMDGQRPILIEIQALVNPTVFAYPKRVADGLSVNRLQTICAIVSKFSKAKLSDSDVYVRVTGGYNVKDPAIDLALAMALISSAQRTQVSANEVYIGELNLAGRVLAVPRLLSRLNEAKRFGIESGYLSASTKIEGVRTPIKLQKINALANLK